MSKKRAAEVEKWGPVRHEYVQEHSTCPYNRRLTTEVHEIAAGSYRKIAYRERCAWLAVSRGGHEELQGKPYAYQLAFKLLQDPMGFDLKRFCTVVLGRAETAVDPAEVLEEVRKLLVLECARHA